MADTQCRERPLFADDCASMSLAEASVASRFHLWCGQSGRRYVTSVFAADATSPEAGLPELEGASVIPTRRGTTTSRVPLGVFRIERSADRRAAVLCGLAEGADEWHVHLLATTSAAREAALVDLRRERSIGVREIAAYA